MIAVLFFVFGTLALTRGDLDEAEKMLRKSLEINERLGHLEGMAIQYCNLGLIHDTAPGRLVVRQISLCTRSCHRACRANQRCSRPVTTRCGPACRGGVGGGS